MENIKCFDSKGIEKIIKPQFVETMGFKPSENVFPSDVEVIHRGETYYDGLISKLLNRKKIADCTRYYWNIGMYSWKASPDAIFHELKKDDAYEGLMWYYWSQYFDVKEQVGYNEKVDCLVKKTTIIVRTVSGETLYAIFDSNEEAKNVVNEFNSL